MPYYDGGKLWRDGSIIGDIPERELSQLFRVKYTIVSQVNPHVSFFFFSPKGSAGNPSLQRSGKGWRGGFLASALIKYFLLDLYKWLYFIRDMDLLPKIMGADLSRIWLQRFYGNLTIIPPRPQFSDIINLLEDPGEMRLEKFIRNGESATWPKLLIIKNRLLIEKNIKKHLQSLLT